MMHYRFKQFKAAKEILDDYSEREFEHGVDFSDFKHIDLGYTTFCAEDESLSDLNDMPIEAELDMENGYYTLKVAGIQVEKRKFFSADELIEFITWMDFDSLTSVDEEFIEKHHNLFLESWNEVKVMEVA